MKARDAALAITWAVVLVVLWEPAIWPSLVWIVELLDKLPKVR